MPMTLSQTGRRLSAAATAGAGCLLLLGLPLAGAHCAGHPLARYAEFPPVTRYVAHAPFSWPAFMLLTSALAAVLIPIVRQIMRAQQKCPRAVPTRYPFPIWGWIGLAGGLVSWIVAWTRFDYLAPVQRDTFTPLWLAYIVVVNALTQQRAGTCLLRAQPVRLAALAGTSALFWWYFEYLNRFVQNWFYAGIGDLSPSAYALFATLPFATVLPAIASTEHYLATWPRLTAGLEHFIVLRPIPGKGTLFLLVGSATLFLLPVAPDLLFPLLWISPGLILAGLAWTRGRDCVLDDTARGDWSRLIRLALAGLVCGFFWELWNLESLAKWTYAVSYVDRFHLFEMPLLGYAGYLPFGIECALIADLLTGRKSDIAS